MNSEIKYSLGGLFFTWDDEKASENWRKHRVAFEQATDVFLDEQALDFPDKTFAFEGRRNIIGKTFGFALFVVYAEVEYVMEGTVYRIISARMATRKEKKRYEQNA